MAAPGEEDDATSMEALQRLRLGEPITPDQLIKIARAIQASHESLGCLVLIAATIRDLMTNNPVAMRDHADSLAAIRLEIAESPMSAWTSCMELRSQLAPTPAGPA